MNTVTSDYPAGNLRVSDADRDRALAELSEHFQAGRLTAEELDERSGRALRARTGTELSALLADLPRAHDSAPVAVPRGACPLAARRPVGPAVAAGIVVVCLGLLSAGPGGRHGAALVVPVLVVLLVASALASWRRGRGRDGDRW